MKIYRVLFQKKYFEQNFNQYFKRYFENWTSGNDDIDKFIKGTQLLANNLCKALEWVPYNEFNSVQYICKRWIWQVYNESNLEGWKYCITFFLCVIY